MLISLVGVCLHDDFLSLFLLLLAESDTAPDYSHLEHFKLVFKCLRREILFTNRAKCSFIADQTLFLGFIISEYAEQHHKDRRNFIFEPGGLVWLQLRQGQFPSRGKSKLHQRADGPFRLLDRIGLNASSLSCQTPTVYIPPSLSPTCLRSQIHSFTIQSKRGRLPLKGGRVMRPGLLCWHFYSYLVFLLPYLV